MNDNEAQPIFLARISSFEADEDEHGCPRFARVIPVMTPDVVTRPFPIAWTCRGNLGDLAIDSEVVCARFPDGTGLIMFRADGDHTNIFPRDMRVEGDVQIDGDVHVDKQLTADTDVVGGGKSLKGHTHTDSRGGGTSAPN